MNPSSSTLPDQRRPRISVVIAAYNVQACLARTVESVLAQDFQDFEILIVDDGSGDDSLAVARGLASRDARIRVFALAHNQGPSAARNRGLAEAQGHWVAILDADDVFLPARLGHLVELAERRGADVVADNLVLYDFGADQHWDTAFGWTTEHALTLDALLTDAESLNGRPLGWVQPLWRLEFLRERNLEYPVHYRYMEDFFLLASALLSGAKIWLSPRAEYVYTMRHGPISNQASPFSATRPGRQDLTAAVQGLISRYRTVLLPRQIRSLDRFQRRLLVRQAMLQAFQVQREKGLLQAVLKLRSEPAAAWALLVENVRGLMAAVRRRTSS